MIKYLGLIILWGCGGKLSQDVIDTHTHHFTWHSKHVKDSFDIYVSLPDNYENSDSTYHTIYYMDANLKSGKAMRTALLQYRQQKQALNAIAIGVGHFRNYRELRRRDLITPFVKTANDSLISDDDNFGHCEEFYRFLESELIPHIEKNYRCNTDRSFVGHSLGGLFAFYCLFKNPHLFRNHVALSPALWINYYNIYDFEKRSFSKGDTLNASLYLCTGTGENWNRILDGGRQMKAHLDTMNYRQLAFTYKEFEGESHNSEVPLALAMILPRLPKR